MVCETVHLLPVIFTDVCLCQSFVCVLLISPSLLFPWQHGRTGIDWQGSSKGSLATCSSFEAPPCCSLCFVTHPGIFLICCFSFLLSVCASVCVRECVCFKHCQLLGFSFFWLQLMCVTHIGNSYCMFAVFLWVYSEWIAVVQDA